ncbi:MAG: S9 family peptidase [Candidatus Aminicenantes bacterium]|nr:S9 family peptidase [Candidatus Aminicenantes bacterium]
MKKRLFVLAVVPLVLFLNTCKKEQGFSQPELTYPETKKADVADDYFGTKVPDPYRWFEDLNSEDVKAWVEAENEVTFSYLEQIPFREKIRQRLTELYDYPKYSSPYRVGDHYFFYKNEGLQNQSVIYVQKGLEGEPEVFIDPNELSPDGTVRIYLTGFSEDNRYAAYSRSEAGSDWQEIRIMEIATKKELEDRIHWVKFSGAAWYNDGFFYSGYDKPEKGEELKEQNKYQKIFYHKLGDPQEKDKLIYEDREHPLRYVSADVTEDSRYLILVVSEGTSGNELYYKELGDEEAVFKPLVTGFDYDTYVIDNMGKDFLAYTNIDAPNYRVVKIDPEAPEQNNWSDIIPEKDEVLNSANTAGGYLFCRYLKDAHTQVFQHDLEGNLVREIELPDLGTASGFGGRKEHKSLFYVFTSFTYPPTIFKYQVKDGTSEVFRKTEVPFNPEDYETRQVFYTSKDGTQVPLFIVHKKGIKLNGKNPALLYGYGGFNISLLPGFSATRIFLLENGFIYAQANLRGGGEYGEEWHKAGMLLNKQNVFDDFIAAAEYLINEKYTSQDKLAIAGGSNGGLLVGAAMTQRPDLFAVALPAVGVMDMLRYHKFTVGWGWAVEYGSSDEEEHFKNLYAYSPLHNIKQGVCYPATLVTTADHDDRVVPAHSFKFIAALQEKHACDNPVLIRIETRSGHGSSSTTKMIDELTDEYAFMCFNLGVVLK